MPKRFASLIFAAGVLVVLGVPGFAQTQQTTAAAENNDPPKRILGIVPNYRTTRSQGDYMPLSSEQKFKIAAKDSFDPGTLILSGLFAGESQLTESSPSFGQGPSGYARYYAASYGDFVIGNFMTGAIYPSIFHQDPRYFQRQTGSTLSRLGYAVQQIFWTRTDSGRMQFNFSEILGNSTSVAISNAYYPDNRTASEAATRLSIQIGVDMAGNILKEFSPELSRLLSRKHSEKEAVK
ncbi:MAG TPA: hypothetical protein VGK48_10265 [Terriglobia bacterium]|jgi:hypothetical protein